jgi:hypothetical protein
MAMTLQQARDAADERFRALAGVKEGEAVGIVADVDHFRPLFVGLDVDAREAMDYAHECAYQVCVLIDQGIGPPLPLIDGAIVRSFLVGVLVGEGKASS